MVFGRREKLHQKGIGEKVMEEAAFESDIVGHTELGL